MAPAAETVQAPGDPPVQGEFLQVLAGRLGERTDGHGAPEDQAAQKPDSTLVAALLAAFAECGPTGLTPETGTASELGPLVPDREPSSIPNPLPGGSAPLLEGQAGGVRNPQIHGERPATLPSPGPSTSDLLLPGEEQGGKLGRMDPAQNFIPEVKVQGEKGYVVPESIPGKAASGTFLAPDVRAKSKIAVEMNQEGVEPFDPPTQTKNAPGFPKVQDPLSGKGLPGKENGEQTPTAGAPAGAKSPVREEAQILQTTSKDPASSPMAREFATAPREENDGFSFPGIRQGQVPPSGKETQTLLGLYKNFAESTSGSLERADHLGGGRETPAAMRGESPEISQQVGERVLWLIRNQGERIRISLDPPELGHLFLEIHRTKENIHTTLYTDNPMTKVTLEAGQREIQRIIESEGFKMERFDVLVQEDLSRFQERRDGPFHSDLGSSFFSGNTEAPVSSESDSLTPVPRRGHSGSQYLDLFV
ncbi:MAG: hypothetical protein AMJ94_10450 [Deltaproteobacteria bacterium SM23_61]|nr:MAG: hypothetical protein AMJ94_10450 [Deltaproteobacteria bacterium SM23_61]